MFDTLSPQTRQLIAHILAMSIVGMVAKELAPQMRRNLLLASLATVVLYDVIRPRLTAELLDRGI